MVAYSYFILTGNLADPPGNLPKAGLVRNTPLRPEKSLRRLKMLWTITIILFILWVVGLVSSYTMGGWIHILLVLAIIVLIFNLLSGRRAL
jgi:hypothetical protein